MIKKCKYVVLFFLTLVFFSCSGSDPSIYTFNWALQAIKNNNITTERLMLDILADDEDGFNELYELYIINDDAELYWKLTSDEWFVHNVGEIKWIAVNSIYTPGKTEIPRGKYRLLLRDLSGFQDEKTFTLQKKDFVYTESDFPSLVKKENYLFTPRFPTVEVTNQEDDQLLQLLHPPNIVPSEPSSQETQNVQLLGINASLFTVKNKEDLLFTSETSPINFDSYLHYQKSPNLILSSGPYSIRLE